MTGDRSTIVGRTAEVDALKGFVGSIAEGPAMMLLIGEAGIGKSALWREGVSIAEQADVEVLRCRPARSESQLAFAALSDLLARVPRAAYDVLPGPQRKAIEVALLLAEPTHDDEFHPRAVGLAVLGLLAARANIGPVLIAVDDAHWLDPASQRVLEFVLRRLDRERVGVLATTRVVSDSSVRGELGHDAELPLTRLRVGPLSPRALESILRDQVGDVLDRRTVDLLQRSAAGNPLFALEIAHALGQREGRDPDADLPLPASLLQLLNDRLAGLGPAVSVVQAAAAMSRPTTSLVAQLCGTEMAPAGIRAAVRAGVLVEERGRLEFTHPLLATAAYAEMDAEHRRSLHSTLATLLDDVEERARHLALAADGPSREVADALDLAARRARGRGAPDAAATLWEAAARLTPPDLREAATARRIEAAQCWSATDEVEHARATLEALLADLPAGATRGRVLARWAWTVADLDGFDAAVDAFRSALREVAGDAAAEIDVQLGLAWALHSSSGVDVAEPHARRALALAEQSRDPRLIAPAATLVAFLQSLRGAGLQIDTMAPVTFGEKGEWAHILSRPDWLHGMLLEWGDDLLAAREHLARMRGDAMEQGNEHALPAILFHLARTELLMGDWISARRSADACVEMTATSGQASERPYALVIGAIVEAHLGEVESVRARIADGFELTERFGARPATMELLASRGFLELSLGAYDAADRTFGELDALTRESQMLEPGLFRHHGDAIEVKIARGQLVEAEALVEHTRDLAERLDRAWLQVIVARGTGLLEAATGHLDVAVDTLTAAAADERLGQPFERARTLLALGAVQRRQRKKAAARASLDAASEIFEQLGARLWVERTGRELSRIGGRRSDAGLTPTERRVAELIAAGRTYREAAAELFISPKTVQWNLSKVYDKLGIRSRAELPGRLPER